MNAQTDEDGYVKKEFSTQMQIEMKDDLHEINDALAEYIRMAKYRRGKGKIPNWQQHFSAVSHQRGPWLSIKTWHRLCTIREKLQKMEANSTAEEEDATTSQVLVIDREAMICIDFCTTIADWMIRR
ncbi:Uncharacterized protein Fot_50329 [Forsythia ovata]|uniref:Uncharacterized protein n=1 Tax=Forsythia ovata TaxID=205694 RepID=A0ABD1PXU3_9LAMI